MKQRVLFDLSAGLTGEEEVYVLVGEELYEAAGLVIVEKADGEMIRSAEETRLALRYLADICRRLDRPRPVEPPSEPVSAPAELVELLERLWGPSEWQAPSERLEEAA